MSTKLRLRRGVNIEDAEESKWYRTCLQMHIKPKPNDGLYMNIFTAEKLKLN